MDLGSDAGSSRSSSASNSSKATPCSEGKSSPSPSSLDLAALEDSEEEEEDGGYLPSPPERRQPPRCPAGDARYRGSLSAAAPRRPAAARPRPHLRWRRAGVAAGSRSRAGDCHGDAQVCPEVLAPLPAAGAHFRGHSGCCAWRAAAPSGSCCRRGAAAPRDGPGRHRARHRHRLPPARPFSGASCSRRPRPPRRRPPWGDGCWCAAAPWPVPWCWAASPGERGAPAPPAPVRALWPWPRRDPCRSSQRRPCGGSGPRRALPVAAGDPLGLSRRPAAAARPGDPPRVRL